MLSKQECQVFKTILKNKIVYLNCSERDCDGVWSEYGVKFTTMFDFTQWLNNKYEWIEGAFNYEIVSNIECIENSFSYGGWE
jgi:hypothetical protein